MKDHVAVLECTRQVVTLQAENERLHAALEAIEFVECEGESWCPWCEQFDFAGHSTDCQRQSALGIAQANAHMSDHTIYAATVKQVANLQAENARLKQWLDGRDAEIDALQDQIIAADSAYNADGHTSFMAETTGLVRMCHEGAVALAKNARLRTGLLAWKIDAAAESLHTGHDNAARASAARIEGRIAQLLAGVGLALLLVLGYGGAAHATPDPVPANTVQLVGFDGNTFRYAITVAEPRAPAEAAPNAPACYGTVIITLCGRHVIAVTGLPATWDTTSVTITDAPVGTSYVTVATDALFDADSVGWTLTVADAQRYAGTTSGPACNPTAVTLAGSTAESDQLAYLALLLVAGLAGSSVLLWARRRIRGK